MPNEIPIKLDGDGRLFGEMSSTTARLVLEHTRASTILTAGDFRELASSRSATLTRTIAVSPHDNALDAESIGGREQRRVRSSSDRQSALHDEHPAARWRGPALGREARTHVLRTIEARVFDGRWRLQSDEGVLQRASVGRAELLPLFGHCFVLAPIAQRVLFKGDTRDVVALCAGRTWSLRRFEGVRVDPRSASLVVEWRSRIALDRRWSEPLVNEGERRVLRYWALLAVVARDGFVSVQRERWRR